MVTNRLFCWFSILLTCLMVLIFNTSITRCIAAAYYVVGGASRLSLLN